MIWPATSLVFGGIIVGLWALLTKTRKELSAARSRADESNERYELLMTNLTAAVVVYGRNGSPIMVSPYAEVLTGYPRSELISPQRDKLAQLVLESDRPIYERACAVVVSGEPFEARFRIAHKAGLTLWIESRSTPILDHLSGESIGSLSILFDVTRTVRIQEQLEIRSRDIQEFSSMLSHDLKGPIFAIKGMLGVIDEDMKELPAPLQEPLEHIRRNAKRLEELVTAFLSYSRLSLMDLTKSPISLPDFLKDLEAEFKPAIDAIGGALLISQAPNLSVTSDKLKLYQILANLLQNAIKYRSPDRPLQVELHANPAERGASIRFQIKDNGTGIPETECAQIFRPFHRVPGVTVDGSGIGLATVKKLTELLGGSVQVQSTYGRGSSFEVIL